MGTFLALQHSTTHFHKIPKAYSRSHFLRATPTRHGDCQMFSGALPFGMGRAPF